VGEDAGFLTPNPGSFIPDLDAGSCDAGDEVGCFIPEADLPSVAADAPAPLGLPAEAGELVGPDR